MAVKRMLARFLGVAVMQGGVWQKRLIGVTYRADVRAFVLVGAVRCRLGRA